MHKHSADEVSVNWLTTYYITSTTFNIKKLYRPISETLQTCETPMLKFSYQS